MNVARAAALVRFTSTTTRTVEDGREVPEDVVCSDGKVDELQLAEVRSPQAPRKPAWRNSRLHPLLASRSFHSRHAMLC